MFCYLQSKQPPQIQRAMLLLKQAFIKHNMSSTTYIDLKSFIGILRNKVLYNMDDYNIENNKDANQIFIDIFNKSTFLVKQQSWDYNNYNNKSNQIEPKTNYLQLILTMCLNDRKNTPAAIQVC